MHRRLAPVGFAVFAAALSPAHSLPAQPAARADGVTITYVANEGVLLSSGTRRVLIDGLFLSYGPEYALPADSTQAALAQAASPFTDVDLVLVTHRHGDHFHPAPVAAHLRANTRATLVTSRQVIDSLRAFAPARTLPGSRLLARTTAPGTRRREVVNGIALELLGLRHGYWRNRSVQHLGYIVELGRRRVLHLGDAELTAKTLAPFRLDTARIDVALVPFWVLTSRDGREIVRRWIRPRQVVAIHVPPGDQREIVREVQAAIPGAVVLTRSLESHTW